MEFESLNQEKFKDKVLSKEKMYSLRAGGMPTGGGTNLCGTHGGQSAVYDYSYDSVRDTTGGGTYITYHGRTNIRYNVEAYDC